MFSYYSPRYQCHVTFYLDLPTSTTQSKTPADPLHPAIWAWLAGLALYPRTPRLRSPPPQASPPRKECPEKKAGAGQKISFSEREKGYGLRQSRGPGIGKRSHGWRVRKRRAGGLFGLFFCPSFFLALPAGDKVIDWRRMQARGPMQARDSGLGRIFTFFHWGHSRLCSLDDGGSARSPRKAVTAAYPPLPERGLENPSRKVLLP